MKQVFLVALFVSIALMSCGDGYDFDFEKYEYIVDDNGVPTGNPGTENMIGYYSNSNSADEQWQAAEKGAEEESSYTHYDKISGLSFFLIGNALRIVDEKTIYLVKEEIGRSSYSVKEDEYNILLKAKEYQYRYSVRTYLGVDFYTSYFDIYHTIATMPDLSKDSKEWEGRYALNGNKMTVNTDLGETFSMSYTDGEIEWEGIKYKKVR